MSKRFTDSNKWDDPFFCELNSEHKLLWLYLLDKCDHAGVYKVNFKNLNFALNNKFTPELVIAIFGDRITIINSEKWFIPKFITFQYGELDEKNRVHFSIMRILEKEGVFKGLKQSIQGRKDKDKEKDIVFKDLKSKAVKAITTSKFPFKEIADKYPNKDGLKLAEKYFDKSVKTDKDWQDINKALDNYLHSKHVKDGFIKNCSTWFNNWRDWIDCKPEGDIVKF